MEAAPCHLAPNGQMAIDSLSWGRAPGSALSQVHASNGRIHPASCCPKAYGGGGNGGAGAWPEGDTLHDVTPRSLSGDWCSRVQCDGRLGRWAGETTKERKKEELYNAWRLGL